MNSRKEIREHLIVERMRRWLGISRWCDRLIPRLIFVVTSGNSNALGRTLGPAAAFPRSKFSFPSADRDYPERVNVQIARSRLIGF